MRFSKNLLYTLFLLLNIFNVQGQNNKDFAKEWKLIADYETKGLTKSALDQAVKIFDAALSIGNEGQQIKSAMYQMKYRNMVEENNQEKNIFYLDTLIAKTKAPAKNILLSMKAELLLNYKQNNRYKFYDRTNVDESKQEKEVATNIATWSLQKLNEVTTATYKASLLETNLLQTTKLNGFDAVINKGKNTEALRPTLYDLLAHRALDYFMSSENDVTNPSYKFILNDERLFGPESVFAQTKFTTQDTASLYYNALFLFQDLIKFHLKDAQIDALIDADLKRLSFVYVNGVFNNKNSLYENALLDIEKRYKDNPVIAKAMLVRAQMYADLGADYQPITNTTYQFHLKKAITLATEINKQFPKSISALNAQSLIKSLSYSSLDLAIEKVNLINEPFRSLVTYKNVGKVYFRLIKTSREEIKNLEKNDYDKIWSAYTKLNPTKSWNTNLPTVDDFQSHSTEIKIDGLPQGMYILLASTNENFSTENNLLARQITYISNISSIINNNNDLYVVDRNTGEPIANAEVSLWKREYNYSSRKYDEAVIAKYATDKNGFTKIKNSGGTNYYNYYVQIKTKKDELFNDDYYYFNENRKVDTKEYSRTFLFTDRALYRPGQTIFFKGIMISTSPDRRSSKILASTNSTILLYDVNHQKIGSLKVRTNEFGSYNGSFVLPEGILNGQFTITDSVTNSNQYLSVEEYKRPKFVVEIEKPKGSYRVNDGIEVTGNAKAYAGYNIDGATVKYRVVRKVQYPIWFGWTRMYYPQRNAPSMEIANGYTTTDADGNFIVKFKAIPDESVDKKDQPTFYYEVSADITDINGETRSSNTSIAVSYQALQLDITALDKLPTDSLGKIKITSTNKNGIFEKSKVKLELQKLQNPGKIFRKRYWNAPDLYQMTKEEFSKAFPNDVYANEDKMSTWATSKIEMELTDSTKENGQYNIPTKSIAPGWYKIVVSTKDKFGEDVKAEKFVLLYDKKNPTTDEAIFVDIDKTAAQPGDQVNYAFLTGFKKIWLIENTMRTNQSGSSKIIPISNSSAAKNSIRLDENDLGGVAVNYIFVQNNRVYQGTTRVNVPWTDKELSIKYETFRDKLLPGAEEKWTVEISGSKSEKVAAESLISMYDASLDQFKPHNWNSINTIWPSLYANMSWMTNSFNYINTQERNTIVIVYPTIPEQSYAYLLSNGWADSYSGYPIRIRGFKSMNSEAIVTTAMGQQRSKKELHFSVAAAAPMADSISMDKDEDGVLDEKETSNNPQIRKNFNETAFFFPELKTDADGKIKFSFTIPEALTTWKLMTFAHSKDLASAYDERTVITQKPLMVQPNAPRFVREGDEMEFSGKVVNMTDKEIIGTAQLELFDAASNKPVDGWFKNVFPNQYFTVPAGQSVAIKFPIGIPISFNSALQFRMKATSKDGSFTDGEESMLPVLTNRMLVTETFPINMRNTNSKTFKFDKLLNSASSGSLTNHSLTVEYSSNPAWYAVQSLPYLMEYPYECAEQSFNRFYANSLASMVSNSTPKIKAVFEQWKNLDTAALMSNLQKNQELKSALLEETPWVLQAKNENEQKKNIGILFDMVRLSKEKTKILNQLKEMQSSNGGFTWFKGGPDDRYITQYITTGIGHLNKLGAADKNDPILQSIIKAALPYLDARIAEDYNYLLKSKVDLKKNNLNYTAIQYLYLRSFFPSEKVNSKAQTAYNYYREQAKKYWLNNSKYMQAMIALTLQRDNDKVTPKAITKSLKENSITSEEMGMYFKDFTTGGYYWYQAPIESQAMMIEAFSEIDQNNAIINDLKTWLLKQKQTQNWKTTKATAEACYALLLNGSNWLAEEKSVKIELGNTTIKSEDQKTQAGTGYFKQTIEGNKVEQGMGNIRVSVSQPQQQTNSGSTSWGAIYWQYFENLDKITSAATPLKLVKKLYVEKNSDKGPVLTAVKNGDELRVGDKIKVRIELTVDRDMEYVHMKDMRAACMEPTNVLSGYKYQGGLGYYESTKDASTNFFFSWLSKGTYVFEYPLFVTHQGNYSNGITTIQSMYAPEFTSHSEGIRVNVK